MPGGHDLDDYARRHRHPTNLLVHMATVPIFVVGSVVAIVALLSGHAVVWGVGVALVVYALFLQRWGHSLEETPPTPFTGIGNAVHRLLREQFVTFPRFVLTGRWMSNWQRSRTIK